MQTIVILKRSFAPKDLNSNLTSISPSAVDCPSKNNFAPFPSISSTILGPVFGGMLVYKLSALLALVCLSLGSAPVYTQDRIVVFGGDSYLRAPVSATESFVCTLHPCPITVTLPFRVTNTQNLNGFELSGTYRFLPFLGVAADLSANYGTAVPHSSSNVHQYTGMVGPEVSLPSRVSPFAHALFGGTHQTVTSGSIPTNAGFFAVQPNTIHSFATAIGAGIDLKLVPHVWIRPIQIDYLLTHLNSTTQNQPRVSAGVVLHF